MTLARRQQFVEQRHQGAVVGPPPATISRPGTDGRLGTTRAIDAAVSMVRVAAPSGQRNPLQFRSTSAKSLRSSRFRRRQVEK